MYRRDRDAVRLRAMMALRFAAASGERPASRPGLPTGRVGGTAGTYTSVVSVALPSLMASANTNAVRRDTCGSSTVVDAMVGSSMLATGDTTPRHWRTSRASAAVRQRCDHR